MTNDELFEILSFEDTLESVEIISQEDAGHDALFIRATLHYPDDDMTLPFVHYPGHDWVFTPRDWQAGNLPESVDEIGNTEWRVDDTDTEGVMFMGVPMLAPWVPEPNGGKIENARVVIGRMVRQAREKAGLSVRELAERAGMSHSHIVRIEAGRYSVTIDTLTKLGNVLGFEVTLMDTEAPGDLG